MPHFIQKPFGDGSLNLRQINRIIKDKDGIQLQVWKVAWYCNWNIAVFFIGTFLFLIQFLREQILDFCDNAKRGENFKKIGRFWFLIKRKKCKKSAYFQRICTQKIFFCQIASDLNLKQKEFEKFELLKSTSKSTLIHVRQAVSGAFRWWNRLVFVVFTFFLPQKYKHAQDNNLDDKKYDGSGDQSIFLNTFLMSR